MKMAAPRGRSPAAGRFCRIAPGIATIMALIVAAACGLLGCSHGSPAARQEQTASPAVAAAPTTSKIPGHHAGATGSKYGSYATAGDSVPKTLRGPCAEINNLVHSVVSAAPASTKITEVTGPRAIVFHYLYAKAQTAGCDFVVRGSDAAESSSSLYVDMTKTFEKTGWMSMGGAYTADGADGSDDGYSRSGLACVIEGRWDGGDDSDPKLVPSPDFDVFITCAPLRADDKPGTN